MKSRARFWILTTITLLIAGGGAWWLLARHSSQDGDDEKTKESEPVASVKISPLHHGKIARTLIAYGAAASAPGGTRSVAFPFECRVVAVSTNIGQMVAAGEILLKIEPSADARLALDTAKGAQDAAEAALKDAQRRFQAHLATNADLAAAESAAREARLKLDSLRSRTPGADGAVEAPAAGVVTAIAARPGAVIPAGGALIEIAVGNRLEARLGIAPPDAGQVKLGQAVRLTPVEARSDAEATVLQGTIRLIGQSVDPATRMADAFAALDEPADGAPILIGTYLRAEIVVEEKDALLAPRAAVLPNNEQPGHATIFTVKADKAIKHDITTGLDDGVNVEIVLAAGNGAPADGANAVTEGASELEDGMAVEIAKPGKGAADEKDAEDKAP